MSMRFWATIVRFSGFFCVIAMLCSCNNEDMPPTQEGSLWEIIQEDPDFSLLRTAIGRAGLDSALQVVGPITLFAPNNAAVQRTLQELGVSSINQIPIDFLQAVLLYHIIPGRNLSSLLSTSQRQTLLPGFVIDIRVENGSVILNNDFTVLTPNLDARNGVLHIIDGMMIPPTNTLLDVAQENGYTSFITAVVAAGLENQLVQGGPFTLMIPTNEAIDAFLASNDLTLDEFLNTPDLQAIIGYHVIPGLVQSSAFQPGTRNTLTDIPQYFSQAPNGNFFLNGTTRIVRTNLTADNGLIHELDQVIIRPLQSISEILAEQANLPTPEFTLLKKALDRADLLEVFQGSFEDNFTLFAPTDQAFEVLLEEMGVATVEDIPVETLTSVLLYHVIGQRLFIPDLREGQSLPTLLEEEVVTINLSENQINDSVLIPNQQNILGKNGVIHAIDRVLIPG